MQKKLRDIIKPTGLPYRSEDIPVVRVSGSVDREVFPGYVTDSNFPESVSYVVQNWDRPADYIPGRTEGASVTLSMVYWNQTKLEEGPTFVCPVGNRNQDRLERLLSYAYRVENALTHGKKMLEELKGLFKQVVG
jgi:hypothetical protein